jgi:enoyl-CoA hydratase
MIASTVRNSYDFTHLRVEVGDDAVAVVTFAPRDEGELEDSIFADARDVFSPLQLDPEVAAVVLTGPGDVFFAGAGLARSRRLASSSLHVVAGQMQTLHQLLSALVSFRKPVVAAVGGPARNVGAQIALLCDAAVASEAATFFDDHVSIGLPAGDGGTMLWPLLVGLPRAREILFERAEITAREALELHFVRAVVPADETVAEARAVARRLADLPQLPFLATKLALNNWWRLSSLVSFDLALAYEAGALVDPGFLAKLDSLGGGSCDG